MTVNHLRHREVVVGFWKVGTGRSSITWPQAIEEAIAFGWIDGIRNSIDEVSYTVRFTPRRTGSTWSAINIATAKRLIEGGRMAPAGLAAFDARQGDQIALYSYEQRKQPRLTTAEERALRANAAAWVYFSGSPPSYQKGAKWWIVSAKREETRSRRLAQLIESSAKGRPVPPLTPRPGKGQRTGRS